MASVAAVYTTQTFVRNAEQIVSELRYVRDATEQRRPRPQNKRLWASVQKEQSQVIEEMFHEALRRDPEQHKRWVAVVDGNSSQIELIGQFAEQYGVQVTLILDLLHVLEYLWSAAYAFHAEGSPEAEQWVSAQLRQLLEGRAAAVAALLKRSVKGGALDDKKRKELDSCVKYLRGHLPMLRYDQYLAQGLPIASGVIEGACRHLVKDRMERTGARWRLAGAEAVLKLRAVYVSADFDQYWSFHLQQEWQRNHQSRFNAAPQRDPHSVPPLSEHSGLHLID